MPLGMSSLGWRNAATLQLGNVSCYHLPSVGVAGAIHLMHMLVSTMPASQLCAAIFLIVAQMLL